MKRSPPFTTQRNRLARAGHSEGVLWTAMPAIAARRFGPRHYGANLGLLMLGRCLYERARGGGCGPGGGAPARGARGEGAASRPTGAALGVCVCCSAPSLERVVAPREEEARRRGRRSASARASCRPVDKARRVAVSITQQRDSSLLPSPLLAHARRSAPVASAVMTILFSFIVEPAVYSSHIDANQPPPHRFGDDGGDSAADDDEWDASVECYGVRCFRTTHIVVIAVGAAAMGAAAVLHTRQGRF